MIDGEYKINEIYDADIFYLMEVLNEEKQDKTDQVSLISAFRK